MKGDYSKVIKEVEKYFNRNLTETEIKLVEHSYRKGFMTGRQFESRKILTYGCK